MIRHNISVSLTENLVNKTSVMFKEVQAGNTYFVEIIPLGNTGKSATDVFYIKGISIASVLHVPSIITVMSITKF